MPQKFGTVLARRKHFRTLCIAPMRPSLEVSVCNDGSDSSIGAVRGLCVTVQMGGDLTAGQMEEVVDLFEVLPLVHDPYAHPLLKTLVVIDTSHLSVQDIAAHRGRVAWFSKWYKRVYSLLQKHIDSTFVVITSFGLRALLQIVIACKSETATNFSVHKTMQAAVAAQGARWMSLDRHRSSVAEQGAAESAAVEESATRGPMRATSC